VKVAEPTLSIASFTVFQRGVTVLSIAPADITGFYPCFYGMPLKFALERQLPTLAVIFVGLG
jgi:hypothetical protein